MASDKFKWLTQPGSFERPSYDLVIMESEKFAVLPTVGALTELWLVIVPKRQVSTLSELNDSERFDLRELRLRLSREVAELYLGNLYEFEHGGKPGSVVSCGVDQAHLHLVGLDFDLIEAALRKDHTWRPAPDICEIEASTTNNAEYLFVQGGQRSFVCNPHLPTSQWFRKVIAKELGTDGWDYNKHPNFGAVAEMASRYRVMA